MPNYRIEPREQPGINQRSINGGCTYIRWRKGVKLPRCNATDTRDVTLGYIYVQPSSLRHTGHMTRTPLP